MTDHHKKSHELTLLVEELRSSQPIQAYICHHEQIDEAEKLLPPQARSHVRALYCPCPKCNPY